MRVDRLRTWGIGALVCVVAGCASGGRSSGSGGRGAADDANRGSADQANSDGGAVDGLGGTAAKGSSPGDVMQGSGTGGGTGSGGNVAATGGSSGSGGTGGASDTGGTGGDPSVTDPSAGLCDTEVDPTLDFSSLAVCGSCGGKAHCLPRTALMSMAQADLLTDCDADNECTPDLFVSSLGSFLLKTCESLGGAEGRCISTCVPQVATQIDSLPVDVCADDERCAPCYDPITGDDTSACSQSCDTGPTAAPYAFDTCCGGLSVCVPSDIVPAAQKSLLGVDSCVGAGELCAPKDMASDPSAVPKTCASLLGAEGRCLLACLPPVAEQADRLPKDVCDTGSLCAPCFDPLTGANTGACEVASDDPVSAPVLFAGCCDDGAGQDLGACVPASFVPSEQQALLGVASCMVGELCAPKDIAGGTYAPQDCNSWGGGEGRCLPACLPDIAKKAGQLTKDVCDQGELCAPCFDPVTGANTGSCNLEGDTPKDPTPYKFDLCCSDGASGKLGTCVPSALVPVAESSLVGMDTCGGGSSCVPTELASDTYAPTTCTSWLGAEGRCLPSCLPPVAAQASALKKDICSQGKLCVPCFDPVTGLSTGACTVDGDVPANNTPVKFPVCCPTPSPNGAKRGTCVPAQAAGSQAASLPVLNCESQTADADSYKCAPNEKVTLPNTKFPTCSTVCTGNALVCLFGGIGGQPGACAPSCLLTEQTATTALGTFVVETLYGQSTCKTGEDCAPCTDPQTNASTGVCN